MSVPKFSRPTSSLDVARDHVRLTARVVGRRALAELIKLMTKTLIRWEGAAYKRRIAAGETLFIDDVPAPAPSLTYPKLTGPPADHTPKPGKTRKSSVLARAHIPAPDYPFAWREPPLSGNVINGLGETERRRAEHVFFGGDFKRPWSKLDRLYQALQPTQVEVDVAEAMWRDRHRVGVVAREQAPAPDPEANAARIKELALEAGAAVVGITRLREHMRFADFDLPFPYAISVAVPMDREEMVHVPSGRSELEVIRVYQEVNRVAIALAQRIRAMGWPARASTNLSPDSTEVLHIPVAVEAGVGTLGKHGSLVTREHGSNVRLATVLTDLPLAPDAPADFGLEDMCATCRICETNCPPHALSPVKQLVRGETRWYVNFDVCIPYFAANESCGICIEVCPWSEPGRGPTIAEALLARRDRRSQTPTPKLQTV